VSFIIFWQGLALLRGAFAELTDAGIPKTSRDKLLRALDPLLSHGVATKQLHFDDPSKQHLLAIRELRAKRAGSLITVDLTVDVPSTTTVPATVELESKITQLLKKARKEISEVRVKFRPTDDILL
jgi:divalent metal cation (Fe/Co/Zn/Cd) transporter